MSEPDDERRAKAPGAKPALAKGKSPKKARPTIPFSKKKAEPKADAPASPRVYTAGGAGLNCPPLKLDVVDKLAYYIELHCIEEGIFRVPGNQAHILSLLQTFHGDVNDIKLEDYSAHTVCGTLKLYLREQPGSMLGSYAVDNIPNFDAILGTGPKKEEKQMPEVVAQVLEQVLRITAKVPFENKPLLRRLLIMLAYVNGFEDVTKMGAANLGMVFGPSLMKQGASSYKEELANTRRASQLCTFMIRHHEEIVAKLPLESSGFRLFGKPVPFTSTQIALLTTNCQLHTYKVGDPILQEGVDNKKLFLLQTGSAAVQKYGTEVAEAKQNDLLGACSFLGSGIVANTLVAKAPSEVLELDLDFLEALFTSNPKLFMKFYWLLAEKLGKHLQQVIAMNMTAFANSVAGSTMIDFNSSKRRRRKAAVFAGDKQNAFMGVSASSVVREMEQRSGGKMIVVKVFTSLAGSGNFKTIACPEQERVGALLQRCLQKFVITEGGESFELFLLPPESDTEDMSSLGALKPLNRARAVSSACKTKLAMPRLLLAKGENMQMRMGNRRHRRWRYSINQHIVIAEYSDVKYKNNLGTLYISQLHIAHYSKLHREKTKQTKLVLQYESIENVTQSDTSLTLSMKGKTSLLQLATQEDADNTFRLLRTLHKNAGRQHVAVQGETTKFAENIDRFISVFIQKPPVPSFTHPTVIRNFLEATATAIRDHPLWADSVVDEVDTMQESLEKYVLRKLYFKLFASSEEENIADKELFAWIGKLRKFVTLESLGVHVEEAAVEDLCAALLKAENALTEINIKRTPKAKVDCILECAKALFDVIMALELPADTLLPLFTMALMLSNPPQLRSNIEYIQRYRNPAKLKSEAGYVLVQLETALYFLENVDHQQLEGISEEEFEQLLMDDEEEEEEDDGPDLEELQAIRDLEEATELPSFSFDLVVGDDVTLPDEPDHGDAAEEVKDEAEESEAKEEEESPRKTTSPRELSPRDMISRKPSPRRASSPRHPSPRTSMSPRLSVTEKQAQDSDTGEAEKDKKKRKADRAKNKSGKAKRKTKEKKDKLKGQEEKNKEPGKAKSKATKRTKSSSGTKTSVAALSERKAQLQVKRQQVARPSQSLFPAGGTEKKGKHRSVSIQEAQKHVIQMRDMKDFHKSFRSTRQLRADTDALLKPVLRATVVKPHEASSWAEISLRQGQLVLVTTHKGGVLDIAGILRKGWWYGELGGCAGWFPRDCVEVLTEPDSNAQFLKAGYQVLLNLPTLSDWEVILKGSVTKTFSVGDNILEGDRFQHLYLIRNGRCIIKGEAQTTTGEKVYKELNTLAAHETFGELILLLGNDTLNNGQVVAAVNGTEVVALEPEHLKSVFTEDPTVGARFLKFLCCVLEQRIRKTEELVYSG